METVDKLLEKVGKDNISSTSYDTAWIARLKDVESDLGNRALEWICEHQHEDGSWGAVFPFYYHDRVVCTLSAMIALTYKGRRQQDKARIQRGLEALDRITAGATQGLQLDSNGGTVGFEVITPTLVAEAEQLGIIKQQKERILGKLRHLRELKMRKLQGLKISRFITVAHSAEMTGKDKLDLLDVERLQEDNGSVGASPAATAHFALYVKPGDQSALNYLSRIIESHNGGAPALSPFEIFERVWVLWNLSMTNLYQGDKAVANLYDAHMDYLEKQWKPGQGLGLSEFFSVPDADDTIVAYEILSKFGRKSDLEAVLQYEDKEWFRCYHYEANQSVDVNIHALGALKQAGYDKSNPSVQKALNFIRSKRLRQRYWLDKWNLSPYYTTSHLTISATGYDDQLCEESIKWILETQEPNGSWGFFNIATAEETAYCIQALAIWQRYAGGGFQEQIKRAGLWLSENCEPPYPPLWIGKSLYCPEILVKSCLLSALTLAQEG
ncbi:MAG: hypothetical protein JW730_20045 [Anaerolineales bacterium]|nr:hypothetical protein [Anaerolineales bacterium]